MNCYEMWPGHQYYGKLLRVILICSHVEEPMFQAKISSRYIASFMKMIQFSSVQSLSRV